ncbi:DUF6128 domain-containing protein [Anaerostipes sp.]|uniref:DUF6128 domain-containing protein n=1 Tax=Anaerostipes sp. TaxID=1872530 RepID=UPI003FEDD362
MSDYRRIVSYLYEYSHGMKGANVGFAKIEQRQKQLRLYFHVKTNENSLQYKLYFYRFHHGTMEGILIDTIKNSDSVLEFRHIYPLPDDLDHIDGFLIYHSKDHFFGSQWKDHPITIRSFTPLEKQKPNVPDPVPEIKKEETIQKSESIQQLENKEESKTEPLPEVTKTTEAKKIEVEELSQTTSQKKDISSLAEYIEALQLEKDAKEQSSPKQKASFDWKDYPSLPMPSIYHLSPCIKISLEDLSLIPDLPENLKTNGFLLLNYGNFGHLFLAWNSEKQCRYLGVPGIFDNEKRFISSLFGFQEFLTVPMQAHKTGNFGYFILPIQ